MSNEKATGMPSPQMKDTRMDDFWNNLEANFLTDKPQTDVEPRDLDTSFGDKAKAFGAGALDFVGGIGEAARQASAFGKANANGNPELSYADQASARMANRLSPVLDTVADLGGKAQESSVALVDSMSDDGKEALRRSIISENDRGGVMLGDGAGDIDVWAMKFAHAMGTMVPTMAAGGITGIGAKKAFGDIITKSMIKRGASQEVAEAVATKAVEKISTGAAGTTAVVGSVGSAGLNVKETVNSMTFDELKDSSSFREAFLRIDGDQQYQGLSDLDKLSMARDEVASLASAATMGDVKTWGAAAAGSLMGDAMLFKMLIGKGAKGIVASATKGAAGEGIGEMLEEGTQQYAVNQAVSETTGIESDPWKGVASSAIEGGLIGAGTGGAMGAAGGARTSLADRKAKSAEANQNPDTAPEQVETEPQEQDPLQAAPDAASQPSAVAGQPMSTDAAQSDAVAEAVAEALDPLAKAAPDLTKSGKAAPETGDSVTGTSGFDEFADVPTFLRNAKGRELFASTDAQAQAFRDQFDPEREPGKSRGTLDKSELRQPTDDSAMGVSDSQFDEFRDTPASRVRGIPNEYSATQQALAGKESAQPAKDWHPNVYKALAGEYGQEVRDIIYSHVKAEGGDQGATQAEQAARKPFDNKVDRELNQVAVYKPIEGEVIPASTDKPSATQSALPPSDIKADYTEIIPESRRIGKSGVIYANGEVSPDAEGNSAYVPPVLARNQPDTSMDTQSTRDPRSDVAKAIDRAGEATDSVFGPLKTMRITRRGKPFASQKEAQMASRKGIETPVELNGGGYGVAEIAEVEQARAAKPEQAAEATPAVKAGDNQTQTTPAADAGVSVSAVPWSDAIKNNDGTTTLIGDATAIKSWVAQNGIKAIPRRDGMLVAKSASPKLEEIINQKTDEPSVSAEPAQAATPWRELIKNQDGTATLIGDPVTLKTWAKENGIRTITRKDGVMVAKSAVPKLDEIAKPAAVKDIEVARTEVNVEPTEAQKEAGNYKKGHVKLQGLDITLENPKGSVRSGTDANGKAWQSTMAHDYGYIKRTEGADGDHVDAFIGDNPESQNVYVVDQRNADGTFDEHKVMLGFDDETSARAGYLANYSKGWKGLGDVRSMTMDEFKGWIKDGDTTRPAAEAAQASNDPDNAQEAPAAKAASYSRNDSDASGSKEKATAKPNTKGMTKKEVELIAKGFVRQYKGAANILVTVVQTQEEANKLTFGGLPEGYKVHAFYQGDGIGRVVLVADNLTSAKHALQKMRHEVLVHHGFQAVIGDVEYGRILRVLWDARDNKSLKPLWDHVQDVERDTPLEGQLEELLAYVAEKPRGAVGRFVDRIVGMVAQALRKVGFISKVTEAELRNIVEAIGDRMKAVSIYADKETDAEENRKNKNSNVLKGSMVKFSREGVSALEGSDSKGIRELFADGFSSAVNLMKQKRPLVLGALSDLQIDQVYRDITGGAISRYQKLRTQMEADRNDILLDAETRIDPLWDALSKDQKSILSNVMYDATMYKLHPDIPLNDNTLYQEAKDRLEKARKPETRAKYAEELKVIGDNHKALSERYKMMPAKSRELYKTMKGVYDQQWNDLRDAIDARLTDLMGDKSRELSERMRTEMERALQHGPYFPLTRFGDYVVKATRGDEYIREHFESRKDAESAVKQYQRDGYNARLTVKEDGSGGGANANKLGAEIMEMLDKASKEDGASLNISELKDDVWQSMLKMLPDASYAKHAIHRRRVKGASRDAHRAYLNSVYHYARHLSKIKYGHKMVAELEKFNEQIQAGARGEESVIAQDNLEIAQQVLNEMNKRHELNMNPQGKSWAGNAGTLGFLYYIGPSVASAVINMTQNFTVMFPQLGAKYGFANASSALTKAMSDYIRHGKFKSGTTEAWQSLTRATTGVSADEKALLNTLYKAGVLDLTQAHSIAAKADTDQQDIKPSGKLVRTGMRWAGALFHNAEVLNREVAALAAYRLLKKAEPTLSPDQYADKVAEMVYDGHGNYAASNRPRYMRSDIVKVLSQFKIYSQMMTYVVYSNAIKAAKGDKVALKTLGGVLGAHWVMAGVMGLPYPITAAVYALSAAFDDDDDRSGEASFRLGMTEALGKTGADLMATGPMNLVTNLSIAGRTGINDLWWREPNKDVSGDDLSWHYVQQILGPVAGIGINLVRGTGKVASGDVQRGVEMALPVSIRNVSKAYRQATEGEQTNKGDIILDDIPAWNIAMQAIGFGNAQMADIYEARGYIKGKEERIGKQRSKLLTRYYLAKKDGDSEEVETVLNDIRAFNTTHHPTERITGKSLALSLKSKARSDAQTQQGVYLKKSREYLRSEGEFARAGE